MEEPYEQGVLDEDWLDGLEGGTFVKHVEGGNILEFIDNTPRKRKNNWGKDVWEWDVRELDEDLHEISNLVLSTASMRLRRALGKFAPLKGKILKVTRTGEKMDTKYVVLPIEGKVLV